MYEYVLSPGEHIPCNTDHLALDDDALDGKEIVKGSSNNGLGAVPACRQKT